MGRVWSSAAGTVLVPIPTRDGAVSHFPTVSMPDSSALLQGKQTCLGSPLSSPGGASPQAGCLVLDKSPHPGLTAVTCPGPGQGRRSTEVPALHPASSVGLSPGHPRSEPCPEPRYSGSTKCPFVPLIHHRFSTNTLKKTSQQRQQPRRLQTGQPPGLVSLGAQNRDQRRWCPVPFELLQTLNVPLF